MKEYIEPKEGDTKVHCTECNQAITVLFSDTAGKVRVIDNGKTIPNHYRFGIDLTSGGEGLSWLCSGSGQAQVTYVYQPTVWAKNGAGCVFRFKPIGWKPKPKKK
jgi:Tfp pilus tip-associated adhesin PilY1